MGLINSFQLFHQAYDYCYGAGEDSNGKYDCEEVAEADCMRHINELEVAYVNSKAEGDVQIEFAQYVNTAGLEAI